jgi:hypothetical protein
MRILGVAVAVLLLAGCAQPSPVEPVETSTPTIEPAEIPPAPTQVFGGSCSEVFEPKQLSDAVSGEWMPVRDPEPVLAPSDHVVENVGGLACSWYTDAGHGLFAAILPADALSAPEDTACGFATDASAFTCDIDATANGMRLVGFYTAPSGDEAALRVSVGAIEALFTASALQAVPVASPGFDTAWSSAPDCAALEISGLTAIDEPFGTDVYLSPALRSLTNGAVMPQCSIQDAEVSFSVLGGGRWMEAAVRAAPGAEEVGVEGLELVILVPWEGQDFYSVNVFDGVNWLQVRVSDADDTLYPVLIAVVDALNA